MKLTILYYVVGCIIEAMSDDETGLPKDKNCTGFGLVSRTEWLARPPWRVFPMKLPVNHVIIMHTVFGACKNQYACIRNLQFMQDYHMDDLGWWDIAYSFLIGGDGQVYEGVGWQDCGEHTINYNSISIGLGFMGDYNEVAPSKEMLDAAKNLIACGVKKGFMTPTVEVSGHRDVTCSISPGDRLYSIIKQWPNFKGGRLDQYSCNPTDQKDME